MKLTTKELLDILCGMDYLTTEGGEGWEYVTNLKSKVLAQTTITDKEDFIDFKEESK